MHLSEPVKLDGPGYPAEQPHFRVAMCVPHDTIDDVRIALLNSGLYVERGRYQGEQVGGTWMENVSFVVDTIGAPGSIWATIEFVKQVVNRRHPDEVLPDFSVHRAEPTSGSMEYTCPSCGTTYRFGQVEYVPSWCPDVRCDGRLHEHAVLVDVESEVERVRRWRELGTESKGD